MTKSMDETNSVSHNELMRILSSVKTNIHGCIISVHTECKDDLREV